MTVGSRAGSGGRRSHGAAWRRPGPGLNTGDLLGPVEGLAFTECVLPGPVVPGTTVRVVRSRHVTGRHGVTTSKRLGQKAKKNMNKEILGSDSMASGALDVTNPKRRVKTMPRNCKSKENPIHIAAAFACAVTVPTNQIDWVARKGEESLFQAFKRILPEVCLLSRMF